MIIRRSSIVALCLAALTPGVAQTKGTPKKGPELPHPFYWAIPDPLRGDYEGSGGYVAQVIRFDDRMLSVEDQLAKASDLGHYEAHLFHQFDQPHDAPVAILRGERDGDEVRFEGDGWTGAISGGHFKASKGAESFDLHHTTRRPPSLGEKPPPGAVILFDGNDLSAWGRRSAKDWLKEDGPPPFKLLKDGAMEIAPNMGYLLSHRKFGAYKLHVEFMNLGGPTNSGVYLQSRYEANINEVYGSLTANPCTQFDNCTDKTSNPGVRCSRPPLEWQTMDIEFHPPTFDAAGEKKGNARATVYFNGTLYYKDQSLNPPKGAGGKLGESATGPILLQEHGMPCQFRNIWLVELPN